MTQSGTDGLRQTLLYTILQLQLHDRSLAYRGHPWSRSPSLRMYACTHAPTARSRAKHPDVLGFLRREERGHRTTVHRFACKLANAHHRPSALDCRSRERQTEPSWRRRRVPLGFSRLPPLRGVTSSPPTSAPVSLLSRSPIPLPPPALHSPFFSLSLTCHLPVASLRAHS